MRLPVTSATPGGPGVRVAVLTGFTAVALGAGLGRGVLTTYLPVLLSRIRDAPGLIGTVMLVNVASGFLVPLLVGVWSDRMRVAGHGRTMPFVLGGALVASAGLLAIAATYDTGYLALALAAVVAYTGLNAVTTAHRALIAESFSPEARARATGAEELALLGGGLVGVAAGGAMIDAAGWSPFLAAGLLLPVLAVPTVLTMRRRERPVASGAHPGRMRAAYYLRAAARPRVRLLLAAQGLWVLGYAAMPAFFVLYAERVLDLGTAEAGLWLVVFGAVTGLSMLAAGAVRDASRQPPLLVLGVVLMAGGFLAMLPASRVASVAPGLVAAAAGFGVLSTLGFPVFSALIPEGEAGAYTALYFAVRSVAGAIALPATGWAIELTGSYRTLLVVGAVATAGALVPLLRLVSGLRRPGVRRVSGPRAAAWLGMLGGLIAVTLAAGLAVARTPLQGIDERLFRLVNDHGPGSERLDRLVVAPDLRNYLLLTGFAALCGLLVRPRIPGRAAVSAALAGLLSFAVVRAVWALWERPRPEEELADIAIGAHLWAPYPSFPSGHVVVTTAMVVVIARTFPATRRPLAAIVAVIVVTRVLAGAHFPSDVLLGLVVGWASARLAHGVLCDLGVVGPWRAPRDAPALSAPPPPPP